MDEGNVAEEVRLHGVHQRRGIGDSDGHSTMIRMDEIRTPRLRLLLMPMAFLQSSLAMDVGNA